MIIDGYMQDCSISNALKMDIIPPSSTERGYEYSNKCDDAMSNESKTLKANQPQCWKTLICITNHNV